MGSGEVSGLFMSPSRPLAGTKKTTFFLYKGSRVLRVLGGYYSMGVVVVFGPEGPLGFGPIASQHQPVAAEGT